MEYDTFIRAVSALDFIRDEKRADAAVKAVLGILASRLDDAGAHELTDHLPQPLSIDKLRRRQARPTPLAADNYFMVVANQFQITEDQAAKLIQEVLHLTKETLTTDEQEELMKHLPADWQSLFIAA